MQRKVVLTLALVFCLATSAQAALSIVVGAHSYPQGTGVVVIPIMVTQSSGTDQLHGTDLSVQLGGTSSAVAAQGAAPPITYQGAEQFNNPSAGAGSPILSPSMWDQHPNTWNDSTIASGPNAGSPTIPGTNGYGGPGEEGTWFSGSLTFNDGNASHAANHIVTSNTGPNSVEVNLVVDLTGFVGTWPLFLLGAAAGPTDFVAPNGTFVTTAITDGSITVVPEPTSVVLGLFAAAGLGIVAIRKRRARRA